MKTKIYNIAKRIPGYYISSKKIQRGIYENAVYPLKRINTPYQDFPVIFCCTESKINHHWITMFISHIYFIFKYKRVLKNLF